VQNSNYTQVNFDIFNDSKYIGISYCTLFGKEYRSDSIYSLSGNSVSISSSHFTTGHILNNEEIDKMMGIIRDLKRSDNISKLGV
jgi:hypothetical protein